MNTLLRILGYVFSCSWRFQRASTRELLQHRMTRRGGSISLAGAGYVTGLENLKLGANIHIGVDFFIRAEGGLSIGDNTHISHRLTVYTHNHDYEGDLLPYDATYLHRPVSIGRNVWIGANVTILPGAQIGDGAIVGAGAVVVGAVGAGEIFGAAAARKIGERNSVHYAALDAARAYSGHGGHPLT